MPPITTLASRSGRRPQRSRRRFSRALSVATVATLLAAAAACGTATDSQRVVVDSSDTAAARTGPSSSDTAAAGTGPSASAPTVDAAAAGKNTDKAIQASVDSYQQNQHLVGLAVAVVRPVAGQQAPRIDYFLAGAPNQKTSEAVTPQTVFEIGSMSKAFTGDLLAQLVREGKVSLDDPLQKYAPPGITVPTWPATPDVPITLGDLATHQSGLPDEPANLYSTCPHPNDYCNQSYAQYTRDLMWQGLAQTKLLWQPGTNWLYSNFAFGILGTVLADVVDPGQQIPAFNAALQSEVLSNFSMPATQVEVDGQQLARGYSVDTSTTPVQVSEQPYLDDNNSQSGEGGMVSSAADMATWVAGHLGFPVGTTPDANQPLLDSLTLVSTATTICSTDDDNNTVCNPGSQGMGLGWQLNPPDSYLPVDYATKDGETNGFFSEVYLVPSKQVGVVVLTNTQPGGDYFSFATKIVEKVLDQP